MLPYAFSNHNRYNGLRFNNSDYLNYKTDRVVTHFRTEKLGPTIKARIIKGFELHSNYETESSHLNQYLSEIEKNFTLDTIFISVFKDSDINNIYSINSPNQVQIQHVDSKLAICNLIRLA